MRRGGHSSVTRPRLVRAFAAPAVAGSLVSTLPPIAGSEAGTGGPLVLFSEGFEDGNVGARGWFDGTTVPVAVQARPGSAGTSALQCAWTAGANSPTGFSVIRKDVPPTDTIYWSYWIKTTSNCTNIGHFNHVITTADDHYSGLGRNHLTLYDELQYAAGGFTAVLQTQDNLNINTTPPVGNDLTGVTEIRSVSGWNGKPEAGLEWDDYYIAPDYWGYKILRTPSQIITDATKASWHQIECYAQMNTVVGGVGQPNGILRRWVDNTLIHERTDLYLRTGQYPTMQFRTFVMAPYNGGGAGQAQTVWIDDLVVSTGRTEATPPSGGYTNEPAGLVTPNTITATQPNPFDVVPWKYGINGTNYALDQYGWLLEEGNLSLASVVVDPDRGNVFQTLFPQGMDGGGSPFSGVPGAGHVHELSPVATELFLGFRVKLSSNWSDANLGTKLVFFWNNAGAQHFYINLTDRDTPYLRTGVGTEFSGHQDYYGGSYSRGVWYKMEYYVRLNTPGSANGTLKCWVDGVLDINRTGNIALCASPRNISGMKLDQTYGGGLLKVPVDMNIRLDDWYIKVGYG